MTGRAGLCILLTTLLFAGCFGAGGDAPDMYKVTGTVTLDGQPLKEGVIVADPADKTGLPAQGSIVDGKFEFEATPGSKTVRISAQKETGEKDQYGEPITESLIPSEYNSESTLTETVNEGKESNWKFDLKSAKQDG